MNGKGISVILITILALAGVGFLIALYTQKSKSNLTVEKPSQSTAEQVSPTTSLTPNKGTLRTNSTTWEVDKQYEVEVTFDKLPNPAPIAFTLQILYEPTVLRVDDVEIGSLWTGSNVLEEKINNDTGVVMFSAGQGFEDEVTQNKVLAKLKITAIEFDENSPETSIRIGPESATASDGKNLIKLEVPSVVVKLSK
ncbi:MAG: hypothetical protein US60_C0029G0013 [Microgenomates group bacterium GW2011_GWC1_37_8]|uniref:Cohesin domain-containing protein n=1 Tax=Candidatus Woesebacteria bacterium GW2011_GWB1_38_8 TaxID=1618570 RepID=A0A0G0P9I3_9BACT|nr:MAG: hypothetical protein US60_C0029G0013 [Microgenomates group bacterium GW2011_GWC1_37_8]KKQ85991.1 MAG: hypothetical protein UT08_C0002G0013 [Candidatus Woesebacteria bacterium GW2011_GWB1_38_8]